MEPTVEVTKITYFYGFEHAHVTYTITPNDADPGSIQSQVKVTSRVNPTLSGASGPVDGSGDLTAGLFATAAMSSDPWRTDVTLDYKVGGAAKTLTATFNIGKSLSTSWVEAQSITNAGSLGGGLYRLEGKVKYNYAPTDPHSYSDMHIEKIEMEWVDDAYNIVDGPRVIWNGDGSKVAGPSAPTPSGSVVGIQFQWADVIDVRPSNPGAVIGGQVRVRLKLYLGGTIFDAGGGTYSLSSSLNTGTTYAIYLPVP